jgi:outer membrane protein OmpA-like peptidoglycan-associated protein
MKRIFTTQVFFGLSLTIIMSLAGTRAQAQDKTPQKPGVSIIITQSPKIIVQVAAVNHNNCFGETKGAINIEPSGGYPPYRYHWAHGDSTQDVAALKAGKYRVAVSDGFSCSDTVEVEIKQPTKMDGKVVKTTDILCYGYNNGEVDIAMSGGKAPYTFNWSNGAKTEDLKGVNSGSYSVLITDANLCQEIVTAEVHETPLIVRSLDDIQNIKCNGDATGSVDITVGGGVPPYSYEWNSGSREEDLRNLKAGVYEVVVKDSKGCTEVSSTKVIEPAAVSVTFDEIQNLRCFNDNGGSININVVGGKLPYTYLWNNGANTQDIRGISAGDYSVKITDNNGCAKTVNTKVTEPALMNVNLIEAKDVSYNGAKNGSIDIDVTGGVAPYKYKWSNGLLTQDIANLEAGAYSVRVNDAAGCAKILNAAVTQPTSLVARLDNVTQINCNGNKSGEINVSVVGGVAPYSFLWSNGETTKDLKGLGAGKYSLVITDKNDFKQKVEATISEPPPFKAALVSVNNITCNAGTNGAIDIKAEGGVLPYRYRWSNGQAGQDLINIPAGDYTVKIMDANGCELDLGAKIIQPDAVKLAFDNITNVNCNAQPTGAVNLSVVGGTAPYKYKWSNGSELEDIRALRAGSYNVKVTDGKGCSETLTAQITEPKVLVLSEGIVKQVDCLGNGTGAISVNVAGGVSPYKYAWSSGDTSKNLTAIRAGTYNLRTTDANGCVATYSKVITEPTKLVRQVDAITNILCFGEAKGGVNISVNGGVTPYSYRWSNGANTQDLIGVKAGQYSVKIRDANNCTDSVRVTVRENPVLTASNKVTNINCFSLKSGSVDLTATGGVRPYRYQWSNNQRTEDIRDLGAGNYSVIVRDSAGCTTQADAQIIEPPRLVASLQSYTDINCNSDKTGAIAVRVSGGSLPYKYKWSSGDTTLNLSNVVAGNYSFTVTDKGGCVQNVRASLSQPTKIDNLVKAVTNVSCFGDKSGAIDVSVSGGVGPYAYKWSNGATTQDLESVAAGKYSVQLTDAKGCVKNLEAEITQPADLIVKVESVVDILCFGNRSGSVSISTTGGAAPYKYLWSNGATTQNLAQLPAGNYTVTVTDSKGCSKTISAPVNQPPQLVAKLGDVKHINCFGDKTGSIPLTVSGGATPYVFKWSNGATEQNLNNVAAGVYTVIVTDKNGCSQTLSATINQPLKLVSSVVTAKDVTCFGASSGSINISVVGGNQPYKYSWSNGATTQDLNDIKAGTYNLTITDASGCTDASNSVTIKEPTLLSVQVAKVTDIIQYGLSNGAVEVNVSGGVLPYKYSWSNGAVSQDIAGVPGGNYSLKVADANGCEKSIDAIVKQPPPLLVKLASVQDIKCADDKNGSIAIDVTGGVAPYSYKWSNGDSTKNVSNVSAGDYLVTVTDANGHKQILNAKIAQPSAITAQQNLAKNLLCNGDNSGAVQVTVTGGQQPYKYSWSSGQTTEDLNTVPAGDYTLTVTDAVGCRQTLKTTLTQPEAFTSKAADVKNVLCKNEKKGEIHIDVAGGVAPYKYSWSNGEKSKDIVGVQAGAYSVRVTDNNGCVQTVNSTIAEPAELTATLGNVVNNNCFGETKGSIQALISGGTQPYAYAWNTGESTKDISNLAVGDYSLNVTDANGCTKNLKATITGAPGLEAKVREVVAVKCFGDKSGSIAVDVTGGSLPYTYSWSSGENKQNLSAVPAGDYQLTVKDSKGCTASLSSRILQPAQLAVVLDTVYNVKCTGDSKGFIDISVSGGSQPYSYVWSNGAKSEDLINTMAGNYSVKVSDGNGCLTSLNASIAEPAKLSLSLDSLVHVACSGQETGKVAVHATGGVMPYNYLWNTGTTASRVGKVAAGDYTVSVTDAGGCKASFNATLNQPRKLYKNIDAITDIRCGGENTGSIFVTVQEGIAPFTYKWSNGADTEDLNNLPAGNYKLTITEGNGCQSTLDATIEAPDTFKAEVASVSNIKCFGEDVGAIDVTVSGGVQPYQYAWSNGSKTEDIEKVRADSYSLLTTDANGCLKTLQAEITAPEPLSLHIDSVRNVKCCGDASGAVFISVMGGVKPYAYKWSHGATTQDITNLTLGVYTVTVTDANGCVVSTPEEMTLFEQVVSKGMFSTRDILFDVGKATIKPQSFTTINKIASFMKEYPSTAFSIEGHTDSDGDAGSNQRLSEARAEAIRQALIKFGIRDYRLRSKGMGESQPIATNTTVEGKAINRRVEFVSLTGTLEGGLIESKINNK